VRANTLSPTSIVDGAGNSLLVSLYDDDASNSATVATTLGAGQVVTWTYPQWVNVAADPSVSASTASTTLYLERQLQDGSWQIAESRAMATGLVSANARGVQYPSKVWRLRNGGSTAVPLTEWRLDAAASYAPVLTTSLAARYVTPSIIVDANGGTTASTGTSGLSLQLAGTVGSPGGGSLAYAWAAGFTPPDGFGLTSTGLLSVPARESMPTGQPLLSIAMTDPRGYAATRVVPFVADTVRASTRLTPAVAKVVGPDGGDVFNGLVDGSNATVSTLQPNQTVTWTFDRYVAVGAAATTSVSASSWQLEIPAQAGGWAAVETSTGLSAGTRASKVYRLRNTGASAITVGEYNIDGATQGGVPTAGNYGQSGTSYLLPSYDGTAYATKIQAVSADPYYNQLTFSSGTLPAGVTLDSAGNVTLAAGLNIPTEGIQLGLTLTNGLGRTATYNYIVLDKSKGVPISAFGSTRYYSDGTYAKSCAAYTRTSAPYIYVGATGDGTYRIDPDGPSGPTPPTDVACSQMATATPATTIAALYTGAMGFPGNNQNTTSYWVIPSASALYNALADLHDYQIISSTAQSEQNYDRYGYYAANGTMLASGTGYTAGYTFYIAKSRAKAFSYTGYSTDGSANGGAGPQINSSSVTFY
jgi:hypothetical protein